MGWKCSCIAFLHSFNPLRPKSRLLSTASKALSYNIEKPFLDKKNLFLKGPPQLAASHIGLDPYSNRFHHPIIYHENYSFADWPPKHTFPMDKFARLGHSLTTTCRTSQPEFSRLPRPLVRRIDDFYRPLDHWVIPRVWFRTIEQSFLHRFLKGGLEASDERYIGFREQTSRPELIERTLLEVAGTILAAQLAYTHGVATNAAGGTHHAHSAMGAGYTILNDLAITASYLMDESLNNGFIRGIKKVLVIDCDVHQGDGTAKFMNQWKDLGNKGTLVTLSIHCASNYPQYKAHSTYDVGLPDGIRDDEYMQTLKESVNIAIEDHDPDFILYDAGVDVYEHDRLGRLNLSEDGIRQRDRWVIERCISSGLPVVGVIGGGYDKDVNALARRHAIIHEESAYLWRKYKMWSQ